MKFEGVIDKKGERGEDAHVLNSLLSGVGTLRDSIRSLSFPCSWFPLSFDKSPPFFWCLRQAISLAQKLSVSNLCFTFGFPLGPNLLAYSFSYFLFTTIPLMSDALCIPDFYFNILSLALLQSTHSCCACPRAAHAQELHMACLARTVAYLSDFFGGRIHLS